MNSFSLDGGWQLYAFPEGERTINHPNELATNGITPLPALVPGNVEIDLQRAGRIPDPFVGDNVQRLREYEGYQWWYTRSFHLPAGAASGNYNLICEGLDTLATIWVNGVEVGQSTNALIAHRFPVTSSLRFGQPNHIAVRLKSALRAAREFSYDPATISWERREEGLYIRKPAHCWGWDIMPRVVSAGIWKSVRIVEQPIHEITSLYFWTSHLSPDFAALSVHFQVRTPFEDFDNLRLAFEGVCGDHQFTFDWPLEFIAGTCQIPVPNPRLWWPKGYGAPNLYQVTARLLHHDELLAERTTTVGLRRVAVKRSLTSGESAFHWNNAVPTRVDTPPDPDHQFVITVNDTPILVKGTNWVPLDALHSRDAERLDAAFALVDDVGVNMIRCWGGNIYESERFFDLCDRHGILVWQDFAFACCRYPQTPDFLDQVRVEAESVVTRLRNHPSLALWCGDNEIDMVYFVDNLSPEHNRLTREVLPQVVHRIDPQRAFIPSSPHIAPEALQTATPFTRTPEQHLWGPRGYFKSRFYTAHKAHFIGEIGYHGCPNPNSIQRFITPEHLWPWQNNEEWNIHSTYHWFHHATVRDRIGLMANQVRELFGELPDNLPTFALASQITQAEAKKYFIESTRLRKWQTSGLIWWNLIDGWPQFSDAVVDYYYGKKLAYHYIRRVQQPVCLIVGDEQELHLPLVACNDSRRDLEVTYRVCQAGEPDALLEGRCTLPANQNWVIGRIRAFASDQRLLLLEWQVEGQQFGSHALLAAACALT